MVFVCEGQSVAGSITSCRDVNNQAVFVLKGKPLNVWDLKRAVKYKNDELYNLMQSLKVEDNTKGLRYGKVTHYVFCEQLADRKSYFERFANWNAGLG